MNRILLILVLDGDHGDFARTRARRVRADLELDGLPGRRLKEAVEVVGVAHFAA